MYKRQVHSILLDGYTFLSPAIYSPSPLGVYIVWSYRVSTLEDAVAAGSVQAADVWRMLPKERRGAGGSSAALPTTATSAAVSYTHLDVYKRQTPSSI